MRQFFLFGLIGGVGFVVDGGLMMALHHFAGLHPLHARPFSFIAAVSVTWLLNRRLTFAEHASPERLKELSRYAVVNGIGALLNLVVFYWLSLASGYMAARPLLTLAVAAAVALVFNFSASRVFAFGAARDPRVGRGEATNTAPASDVYGGVDNLEVMAEARNYNRYLIDLILRYWPGSGPALDFGAGTGTFALAAAARGVETIAVEVDPELRRRLAAQGIEACATLDELPVESVPYIYSFNVLEHIADDLAALRALRGKLSPGGVLLLYVPAFNVLFTSMDRKVGHHRRYTRAGLTRLLESAGFRIERVRYADSLGFFATLLFKTLDNGRGDINGLAVRLYDRIAFPVSRVLDTLVSAWFGKNVLVVARRD